LSAAVHESPEADEKLKERARYQEGRGRREIEKEPRAKGVSWNIPFRYLQLGNTKASDEREETERPHPPMGNHGPVHRLARKPSPGLC
jgi:hypothetical protein